jgi:hypothetical protein
MIKHRGWSSISEERVLNCLLTLPCPSMNHDRSIHPRTADELHNNARGLSDAASHGDGDGVCSSTAAACSTASLLLPLLLAATSGSDDV